MRTISASELKAKCLAILDEVKATGEPVTITKRGQPFASLVPAGPGDGYPGLAGTVELLGDIMSPVLPADTWEAEAGRSE